jgi:hypothetical protein
VQRTPIREEPSADRSINIDAPVKTTTTTVREEPPTGRSVSTEAPVKIA